MSTTGDKRKCVIIRRSPVVDVTIATLEDMSSVANIDFEILDTSVLNANDAQFLRVMSTMSPDLVLDHYNGGNGHTYHDTGKLDVVENGRIVSMVSRSCDHLDIPYFYCSGVNPPFTQDNRVQSENTYGVEDFSDMYDQGAMYSEECIRNIAPNSYIFRLPRLFGPGDNDLHDLICRELSYSELLGVPCVVDMNNDHRSNWVSISYAAFLLGLSLTTILDENIRPKSRTIHIGCNRTYSEYEVGTAALSNLSGDNQLSGRMITYPVNKDGVREALCIRKYFSHMDLMVMAEFLRITPTQTLESIEEAVLTDGYLGRELWNPRVVELEDLRSSVSRRGRV